MSNNNTLQYYGRDLKAMSFAVNYHRWIIKNFKPYLGGDVAEVGAGSGNFSLLLLEEAKHLIAFEPSENMYPILSERLSGEKRVETVNGYFGDAYSKFKNGFDSVMYVNVLEHIEEDEKEFSHMYKALKRGGHALVYVPALSFLFGDIDRAMGHFRRYDKKGIVKIAQRSGFDIRLVKYFDLPGIVPWFIIFVLMKRGWKSSNVSLYDRLIVPSVRAIESRVAPPIGKNLLLVAKKIC